MNYPESFSDRTQWKAAAYIRLSREDGDKAESDSIGNQKKLILEDLKSRDDLSLYDIYVEM